MSQNRSRKQTTISVSILVVEENMRQLTSHVDLMYFPFIDLYSFIDRFTSFLARFLGFRVFEMRQEICRALLRRH